MSDANQEPTMEEILASIRRIISEDDQPQAEPAAVAAPDTTVGSPATTNTADEVLDLTNKVDEPAPAETLGDLDVFPRAEPEPAPAPVPPPEPPVTRSSAASAPPPPAPAPAPAPQHRPAPAPAPASSYGSADEDEGLLSRSSAESAAAAFSQLSQSLMMPAPGRSIEDVVRELLKPMLKEWLDDNLPVIVQRTVQEEVERIARGRVR